MNDAEKKNAENEKEWERLSGSRSLSFLDSTRDSKQVTEITYFQQLSDKRLKDETENLNVRRKEIIEGIKRQIGEYDFGILLKTFDDLHIDIERIEMMVEAGICKFKLNISNVENIEELRKHFSAIQTPSNRVYEVILGEDDSLYLHSRSRPLKNLRDDSREQSARRFIRDYIG